METFNGNIPKDWLSLYNCNCLLPPGCMDRHSAYNRVNVIENIGLVIEHRFAFNFWMKWFRERKERSSILVSIDSHDDIGVIKDQTDAPEGFLDSALGTALYAWLRLRSLNDGQILPALREGLFSTVFVLRNCSDVALEDADILDSVTEFSKEEIELLSRAQCFNNEDALLSRLPKDGDVILDIDIDFFFDQRECFENREQGEIQWEVERIKHFLRKEDGLIQTILPRVKGITIALEPSYCLSIENSVRVLSIIRECVLDV